MPTENTDIDRFFGTKKAAAIFKHAVLKRYIVPFAAKTGSTSKEHRVVIVDGYAGTGRYDDGTAGSPAIIAQQAALPALTNRRIEALFVEPDAAHFARLRSVLAEEAQASFAYEAYHGSVMEHMKELLEHADGVPMFMFLDPFGLGPTLDELAAVFTARPAVAAHGRRAAPATEVLLRFDANAIRRIRGAQQSPKQYSAKASTLRRLDAAAGGSWWQDGDPTLDSEQFMAWFMQSFLDRACQKAGALGWIVPVRQNQRSQPAYYLVFLTRHLDGFGAFAEAASNANEEWRKVVRDRPEDVYEPEDVERFGITDDDLTFEQSEKELAQGWISQIEDNLRALLQDKPRFLIATEYGSVFGDTAGLARERHLRAALRALHSDGTTSSNSVGKDLWLTKEVVRASG